MGEIRILRELGKYYVYEGGRQIGKLNPASVEEYELKPMVRGWNVIVMSPEKKRETIGVQKHVDIPRLREEMMRRGYIIIDVKEGWVRPGRGF